MTRLTLLAPLAGWAAPLDETPDPVFSQRMLGDGVAIDPTLGEVRAPCAGEIFALHASRHAVSLRSAGGIEILVHVGLDTVGLRGEGFEALVRTGDTVAAGDLLIRFDLDRVAQGATSLLSPVVITGGGSLVRRVQDRLVEIGDALMEVEADPATGETVRAAGSEVRREVIVPLAHGIHARPAARIAAEARRFASNVRVSFAGGEASARSPVGLMALGAGGGAAVGLSARGEDAAAAVAALAALIETGLPDEPAPQAARSVPPAEAGAEAPASIQGVAAAPGLAIGAAVRLVPAEIEVVDVSQGADAEDAALSDAVALVRARLTSQAATGPRTQREILEAHVAILDDHGLREAARGAIAVGSSAGAAWRAAIRAQTAILRGLADARLAERADDLLDLERQVLIALSGESAPVLALPDHAIVLANDLAPSEVVALPLTIAGICTAGGGPTSHAAILAAARGIPAVVAGGAAVLAIADGATLILDGDAGAVQVAPGAAAIARAQKRLAERRERRRAAIAEAAPECRLASGERIEILANLGSLEEALAAPASGAEGCGLLRTEFLFLARREAPSAEEQAEQYQAIAAALEGRPLTIRTLDVGGDKPVPYLDLPAQENPALGLRGVRVSLRRPDLLDDQIAAILRVQPADQCRIMIPMVASASELAAVRARVRAMQTAIGSGAPAILGAMIETPAAAVTADLLATEADFLSIGSNDLTQYALAMDRGNPDLAAEVDAMHPAVLRLIGEAARGGRRGGKSVSVCGALAGDALAVPILIGLGVTALSMPVGAVAEIKARVRALTLQSCGELAEQALGLASASEVRALATRWRESRS